MHGADRSAVGVNAVPVRPVRMTAMGFRCNRCELNGDQQDRRPRIRKFVPVRAIDKYYHAIGANGTRDENAANT
jgi:hypothetical protein